MIELDVFIFGAEWGELNVLLDASEQGQGELQIWIFTANSANIFATHLAKRITKVNCVSTPTSLLSHLVHCIESVAG